MMEQPIDIKTLDTKELKAMAYDALATIEQCQRNLEALNNEIQLRRNQPQKIDEPIKKADQEK